MFCVSSIEAYVRYLRSLDLRARIRVKRFYRITTYLGKSDHREAKTRNLGRYEAYFDTRMKRFPLPPGISVSPGMR